MKKFYQALFYMIFVLLGTRVEAEIKTGCPLDHGHIDAVIELRDHIYIMGFGNPLGASACDNMFWEW